MATTNWPSVPMADAKLDGKPAAPKAPAMAAKANAALSAKITKLEASRAA